MTSRFERLHKQFTDELLQQQKIRDKWCKIIDSIDDVIDDCDEDRLTIKHFRKIRCVYLSLRCMKVIARLDEAMSMVGKNYPNNGITILCTRHSNQFQGIIRAEIAIIQKLLQTKKFKLASDSLIGVLFTLKYWTDAWFDTEDFEAAQTILNDFCNAWKKLFKLHSNIHNIIHLEIDTIQTLYSVMDDIKQEFGSVDYKMSYGKFSKKFYVDDNKGKGNDSNSNHNSNSNSNSSQKRKRKLDQTTIRKTSNKSKRRKIEHEYTRDELKSKNMKELKALCKEKYVSEKGKTKNELIERIIDPEMYILKEKRKYHYSKGIKQIGSLYTKSAETADNYFLRRRQFDADLYTYENGAVKQRAEYWSEIMGETTSNE